MKKAFIVWIALVSPLAHSAENFNQEFLIRTYSISAPLNRAIEECNESGKQIESRLGKAADLNQVEFTELKVIANFERRVVPGSGMSSPVPYYACSVEVMGASSKKIKLVSIYESKDHLKRLGYKKPQFETACSDLSESLSKNPNEVFQRMYNGWAIIDGNYCTVRSILFVLSNL